MDMNDIVLRISRRLERSLPVEDTLEGLLVESADAIDHITAQRDGLRKALEAFTGPAMPSAKRTELAYNEFGLRCMMSPLQIARQNARKALATSPGE